MHPIRWFQVRRAVPPRAKLVLGVLSFLLPIGLWCAVSYVPSLWHPQILITEPGSVSYLQPGMRMDVAGFEAEATPATEAHRPVPQGVPANPIYLPSPGQVAEAFYTSFTTAPETRDGAWLHESLWHSIQVIFWAFLISSALGVPIGILCGTYAPIARLTEPFIEFFRYLPAPAFGALAVAVLGIEDAPKIAIIFIGTFFQQVLVIANTTRRIDPALLEAAQTLGASPRHLLLRVVVPGVVSDVYTDMRVLLGWAWTYLIVAELIGVSSGITFFINQQAKYRAYDRVFASIIVIGLVGLFTDLVLGSLGRQLFPWLLTELRGWFSRLLAETTPMGLGPGPGAHVAAGLPAEMPPPP